MFARFWVGFVTGMLLALMVVPPTVAQDRRGRGGNPPDRSRQSDRSGRPQIGQPTTRGWIQTNRDRDRDQDRDWDRDRDRRGRGRWGRHGFGHWGPWPWWGGPPGRVVVPPPVYPRAFFFDQPYVLPPDFGIGWVDPVWRPWAGPPQSLLIESEFLPGPPLPPVVIRLANSSRRPLQVAVVDQIDEQDSTSVRIPPGGEVPVKLKRDSGGRRIDIYRTYDAWGYPVTEEIVTAVPPPVRYEVVVHQWALQSIAIDRTGKSPDPIEDINVQGRGLGRFPLPPGDELRPGVIDVFRAAAAADNPGAVAPIVPADRQPPAEPGMQLEQMLLEIQRRAQSQGRR